METLGIYVQVPFCASKCSFCNFTSKVGLAGALDVYCHALEQEIACLPALYEANQIGLKVLAQPVDTIYIGGGTPSLLGRERLGRIVSALRGRFDPRETAEFTLEVTPGSADDDLLDAVLRLGVDRLSIGAQSFDDGELRCVGRLHSAAVTHDLVNRARDAGFKNISLDLIAGLPYQNETSWLESLRQAMRLRPGHLSVYLFEVDERSRLGSEVLGHGTRYGAAQVPSDDFMADAYATACELLLKKGTFTTRSQILPYRASNRDITGAIGDSSPTWVSAPARIPLTGTVDGRMRQRRRSTRISSPAVNRPSLSCAFSVPKSNWKSSSFSACACARASTSLMRAGGGDATVWRAGSLESVLSPPTDGWKGMAIASAWLSRLIWFRTKYFNNSSLVLSSWCLAPSLKFVARWASIADLDRRGMTKGRDEELGTKN